VVNLVLFSFVVSFCAGFGWMLGLLMVRAGER
jgi:hypothetical protein